MGDKVLEMKMQGLIVEDPERWLKYYYSIHQILWIKYYSSIHQILWIKYYSSIHQILLVGDGDFSFSLCLAQSFGLASNIVASSLDARDDVIKKYKKARSNLDALQKLGACVLHGVDATKMKLHPDLTKRRFDRIIFNFPHAGFHGREDSISVIEKHRNLVLGFLTNARSMLRPNGEIHVNHKTTAPFSDWNIHKLGEQSSLTLIECAGFNRGDYPGYNNKRGDGFRCDEPFPLGKCSTFKFAYIPRATKKKPKIEKQRNLTHYLARNHVLKMNEGVPPSMISSRINGYPPFFGGYTNNELEIYGRSVFGSDGSIGYDLQRSMLAWPASSNVNNRAILNSVCSFSYDLQRSMPPWPASSNVSNRAFSGSAGFNYDLQRSWPASSNFGYMDMVPLSDGRSVLGSDGSIGYDLQRSMPAWPASSHVSNRAVSDSVCSFNYDLQRSMPTWPASSNVSNRAVSGSVSFSYDLQRSMSTWPASSNFGNTDMVPLSDGARARNELYQSGGASYYLQRIRLEPEYFVPYSVGRTWDVETYI